MRCMSASRVVRSKGGRGSQSFQNGRACVKIRSSSSLDSSACTPRHSIARTVGPGASGAGAWAGSGACARALALQTSAASAVASRHARMARSLSSRRVPVIAAGPPGRKFPHEARRAAGTGEGGAAPRQCRRVALGGARRGRLQLALRAEGRPSRDLDEAVANPAIGSRALLRANQTELEIAAWQPAVQGLIDALGERVDPRELGALRAAVRRAYAHAAAVRPRGDGPRGRLGSGCRARAVRVPRQPAGPADPARPGDPTRRRGRGPLPRLERSLRAERTSRPSGSSSCAGSIGRC